jgi:membrane-associated phospholipid phosphatase
VWGAGLIAVAAAGGLYFYFLPNALFADNWVLDVVRPTGNGLLTGVVGLRYPQVIVVGAVIAALVALPTDRLHSLACLLGPPLALVTCELVAKPLTGRHLGGGLSYPSGSTVGAAALAAAAVLAVPRPWRPVVVVVGAAYTLWMGIAVIALQWHYPTDAAAGMAYGVGVVLVVDGSILWGAGAISVRRARHHEVASGGG